MRTKQLLCMAVFPVMIMLTGCASKFTQPDKYSGFLNNYSNLKEAKSGSGKAELRWIDPDYNPDNYDNVVYNPIVYYPVPKPNTQTGQQVLDNIRNYANSQLKQALTERKPLVTEAGPRSLVFRGAITGVDSGKEGLQFYEVVPIAMLVAGAQMVSGHRTMDTRLYFEGELIDAKTNKPVIKVVRNGEGNTLANESTPMTVNTVKKAIDDMATDMALDLATSDTKDK